MSLSRLDSHVDNNSEIVYKSIIDSPVNTSDINIQQTYIINRSPTLPINKELPIPKAEEPVLTMPDKLVENEDVQE